MVSRLRFSQQDLTWLSTRPMCVHGWTCWDVHHELLLFSERTPPSLMLCIRYITFALLLNLLVLHILLRASITSLARVFVIEQGGQCVWVLTHSSWTSTSQELAQHTKDATLQHDTLDSTFVFYEMTKAQLNVYQVCSFLSSCSFWLLFFYHNFMQI